MVLLDVRITLLGGFDVVVAGPDGAADGVAAAAGGHPGQAARAGPRPVAAPRAGHRRALARPRRRRRRPRGCTRRRTTPAGRSAGPRSVVLAGETVALFPDDRVEVDALAVPAAGRGRARRPGPGGRPAGPRTRTPGTCCPRTRTSRGPSSRATGCGCCTCDLLRLAGRWEALAAADPADEQAHLARHPAARRTAATGGRRCASSSGWSGRCAASSASRRARRRCACGPSLLAADEPAPAAPAAGRSWSAGTPSWRRGPAAARRGAPRAAGGCCSSPAPPGSGRPACSPCVEDAAAARADAGRHRAWPPGSTGAWPYAPVLEALADLCRRHPTLLDGLDDAFRDEIERALSGRQSGWDGRGSAPAAVRGRRPSCSGWPPPAPARCWSSTTRTTPTRRACGCCTTWPAAR